MYAYPTNFYKNVENKYVFQQLFCLLFFYK